MESESKNINSQTNVSLEPDRKTTISILKDKIFKLSSIKKKNCNKVGRRILDIEYG